MKTTNPSDLPQVAAEYIDSVVKNMRYRKKVRAEVRQELTDHFTDALADCETDEEKQKAAEELIAEFGNVKMLGKLLRRAKKRCRPMWQKATFVVLKIIGIIFLLLLLRLGYMATGRPTISVDYTQWMNNKVRAGRDESLNAYHDYQKAIELIPEEYPDEIKKIDTYTRKQVKTPEDWKAIEAFLDLHTEAFDAFRTGAAKPYYWNIYQSKLDNEEEWQKKLREQGANSLTDFMQSKMALGVVENLMPHLSGYKRLAYGMMYFQIPFDIHRGDSQQALEDCIALYRFAHHLSGEGVLIEQLVGIAIESIAISSSIDLSHQLDLPEKDLLILQQAVEKNYSPDEAMIDWGLERAFWYDEIQRSFTDDGFGNGRPLLRSTFFTSCSLRDYMKNLATGFPDRKETLENSDKFIERFNDLRRIKPIEMNLSNKDYSLGLGQIPFMLQTIEPAIKKTIEIGWRVRTDQAGLIGTLMILRFEKENGRLPEDWEELSKMGYLKTIPMDPYSDKPLVYKKTEDGFMLYSVGLNFVDDGGIPGTDKNGKPRQWGENGDEIFWPVDVQ